MALSIDWSQHDQLPVRARYDAAGSLIDEAKAAVADRRARIAHDLAQQHGAEEAASILGISKTRVYGLAARYRDAQPRVCDHYPGRSISRYDLLDEVEDRCGLGTREAHEAIHAHLDQLIADDGEDEVIIARVPIRPELEAANPHDLDRRQWLVIRREYAETILEVLTIEHGTE
ncbi:hypothetical protein [Streptomyces sp. CC224B]|uniref:hypothetical protein n=1 Tax=Streptomyces sp. CC224B TaxID=3044571 RepID=UPI0024A84AFC|nr:hypothetical protein [Streptomyces sp. CC224B]